MSLTTIFKRYFHNELSPTLRSYIEDAYPSNHTFKVRQHRLIPKSGLAKRLKLIRKWYPTPLKSLLDLSCCKGFFVFDALQHSCCERALGIDVCDEDLAVCDALKRHLMCDAASFHKLYLHELAAQIDQFGGPFQTILLINTYQYLFFGSDRDPHGYLSHDVIFAHLAKICYGRLIYNNRSEMQDCQNKPQVNAAQLPNDAYSRETIYEAASKYFHVKRVGVYGGYPFWIMDKR